MLQTTVGSVLRASAAAAPECTAVVAWGATAAERRTWTFAALLRDAECAARALLTRFSPGEHIAVYANNSPEWLLLELGAGLAGLVLVTINPAGRARELDFVLRQSRSVGLFHADAFRGNPLAEWVAQVQGSLPGLREVVPLGRWAGFVDVASGPRALPGVQPGDAAQMQYTSGTTGSPKGALLHHRGLTNNARFFMQRAELRAGDVLVHALPFFHTTGCGLAVLGALQVQATQAFLPAFDAGRLLEMMERERATHVIGVPTMMLALLEQPQLERCDLSALRVVLAGGASVAPEIVRAIEARLGVRFNIGYGQTEASPIITQAWLDDTPEDKAHTIGRPIPQTEVRIADTATGETVPCGVVGELCARGFQVMLGYFDMPEATAAAIDRDGWLHTGDLATMDERGYCRIAGRLKDMVIRGGENLFPVEIESALLEHPCVADAAVIGVPDRVMGEELAAFIRIAGARPSVEELRAHVRARLAAPKAPRYWIFVDSLPLTGPGKVQKYVLRQQWDSGTLEALQS